MKQSWSLEITMDEKGIISFINIHQPMIWIKKDERLVREANRHLPIQPLIQDQKTFMETFFLVMKADSLALGDTFTLFEPFSSQNIRDRSNFLSFFHLILMRF
ncbi:MAG: hypothetical protein HDR44_01470 [Allobaculum sp.]|nr:hypothetical protein [Allobaculum sp.]